MSILKFFIRLTLILILLAGIIWFAVKQTPYPDIYQYGVSFNIPYAEELGLDWEKVYTAILNDLGVRHLRLAAHWPLVEPQNDEWNFVELDRQLALAEERGAEVILAVGRRLPRWPECHVPEWAQGKSWEEQKEELRRYLTTVIERYRDDDVITSWQIENEPFLTVFAHEHCGDLDKDFLDEEIALVHALDPSRSVLVTDSGNLGTWIGAYRRGDNFGTSVYIYLWNEATGPLKTVLPPETYIAKRKLMELVFGEKETLLIELSAEPWLNKQIIDTKIDVQLERMNIEKFNEILEYARETRLEKQYLWGAEWWYWLREHDHPEFWERAQELYGGSTDQE